MAQELLRDDGGGRREGDGAAAAGKGGGRAAVRSGAYGPPPARYTHSWQPARLWRAGGRAGGRPANAAHEAEAGSAQTGERGGLEKEGNMREHGRG
eukprot:140449-Chlamydomonas_euryale.AAC.5